MQDFIVDDGGGMEDMNWSFLRSDNCPMCRSTFTSVIFIRNRVQSYRCSSCGFARPAAAFLSDSYLMLHRLPNTWQVMTNDGHPLH